MTRKALGSELQIDRTNMVDLIDDLEARGPLVRVRDARDRRAFLIQATAAGQAAKAAGVGVLHRQQGPSWSRSTYPNAGCWPAFCIVSSATRCQRSADRPLA